MKLIKIDNDYWLLSDDDIKVGDYVGEKLNNNTWMVMTIHNGNDLDLSRQKKIIGSTCSFNSKLNGIAYLDKADINLLLLDIDKNVKLLATKYYVDHNYNTLPNNNNPTDEQMTLGIQEFARCEEMYVAGYLQSLQDNSEKKFTLDNLKEVIAEAWNSSEDNEDNELFTHAIDRIIQSISKEQTEWDVNVEPEMDKNWDGVGEPKFNPKVNDKGYITITKIL